MQTTESRSSDALQEPVTVGLEVHGLTPARAVHWNLSPAELYEHALRRSEGRIAHMGGFTAVTAPHTGRSPNDRFTVQESSTSDAIDWGKVNVPMSEAHYEALRGDLIDYLNQRELFVRDARAGADEKYGISVRVVTTNAWHSLFAYNMFLRPEAGESFDGAPDFTVLHAPELEADPERHGSRTTTAVVVNFKAREVLIAGTRYAGEIKKSIFSVMNFILPDRESSPCTAPRTWGTGVTSHSSSG